MNAIHGHSVFSQAAVLDSAWSKMKGGLSGSQSIVGIEALDKNVDTMSVLDDPPWLDDYEAMRKRRGKDE